jgi:hypothetical protein
MRVRCGYTSCKHNIKNKNGYFCNCKEISLMSYYSSDLKYTRMVCEQYICRKGYSTEEELLFPGFTNPT